MPQPRARSRPGTAKREPEVGDYVEIYWEKDKTYYRGRLDRRFEPREIQRFRIIYDDTETEDIRLTEEDWKFSEIQPRRKRSRSPSSAPRQHTSAAASAAPTDPAPAAAAAAAVPAAASAATGAPEVTATPVSIHDHGTRSAQARGAARHSKHPATSNAQPSPPPPSKRRRQTGPDAPRKPDAPATKATSKAITKAASKVTTKPASKAPSKASGKAATKVTGRKEIAKTGSKNSVTPNTGSAAVTKKSGASQAGNNKNAASRVSRKQSLLKPPKHPPRKATPSKSPPPAQPPQSPGGQRTAANSCADRPSTRRLSPGKTASDEPPVALIASPSRRSLRNRGVAPAVNEPEKHQAEPKETAEPSTRRRRRESPQRSLATTEALNIAAPGTHPVVQPPGPVPVVPTQEAFVTVSAAGPDIVVQLGATASQAQPPSQQQQQPLPKPQTNRPYLTRRAQASQLMHEQAAEPPTSYVVPPTPTHSHPNGAQMQRLDTQQLSRRVGLPQAQLSHMHLNKAQVQSQARVQARNDSPAHAQERVAQAQAQAHAQAETDAQGQARAEIQAQAQMQAKAQAPAQTQMQEMAQTQAQECVQTHDQMTDVQCVQTHGQMTDVHHQQQVPTLNVNRVTRSRHARLSAQQQGSRRSPGANLPIQVPPVAASPEKPETRRRSRPGLTVDKGDAATMSDAQAGMAVGQAMAVPLSDTAANGTVNVSPSSNPSNGLAIPSMPPPQNLPRSAGVAFVFPPTHSSATPSSGAATGTTGNTPAVPNGGAHSPIHDIARIAGDISRVVKEFASVDKRMQDVGTDVTSQLQHIRSDISSLRGEFQARFAKLEQMLQKQIEQQKEQLKLQQQQAPPDPCPEPETPQDQYRHRQEQHHEYENEQQAQQVRREGHQLRDRRGRLRPLQAQQQPSDDTACAPISQDVAPKQAPTGMHFKSNDDMAGAVISAVRAINADMDPDLHQGDSISRGMEEGLIEEEILEEGGNDGVEIDPPIDGNTQQRFKFLSGYWADCVFNLVAWQMTVCLIETPHENTGKLDLRQWAKYTSSCLYKRVLDKFRAYRSLDEALNGLKACVQNGDAVELDWFRTPSSTVAIRKARMNYRGWDPVPNDDEWRSETMLLKEIAHRYHVAAEDFFVDTRESEMEVAMSLTKLAIALYSNAGYDPNEPFRSEGHHVAGAEDPDTDMTESGRE